MSEIAVLPEAIKKLGRALLFLARSAESRSLAALRCARDDNNDRWVVMSRAEPGLFREES